MAIAAGWRECLTFIRRSACPQLPHACNPSTHPHRLWHNSDRRGSRAAGQSAAAGWKTPMPSTTLEDDDSCQVTKSWVFGRSPRWPVSWDAPEHLDSSGETRRRSSSSARRFRGKPKADPGVGDHADSGREGKTTTSIGLGAVLRRSAGGRPRFGSRRWGRSSDARGATGVR